MKVSTGHFLEDSERILFSFFLWTFQFTLRCSDAFGACFSFKCPLFPLFPKSSPIPAVNLFMFKLISDFMEICRHSFDGVGILVWHIGLPCSESGSMVKSSQGTGTGGSSSKWKSKSHILGFVEQYPSVLLKLQARRGERWIIDNLNGKLLLQSSLDFYIKNVWFSCKTIPFQWAMVT